MNKTVIFGAGQRAREIRFLLKEEKNINTDFFVVDAEYINNENIGNSSMISTKAFLENFPPEETDIYIGVGMPRMNRVRERLYDEFHKHGFCFNTFISKYARVYASEIGEGTTIFAGVNIGPGVRIGKCNHFEMGVTVSHDCTVGDYNFFAPGCTLCGDISMGKGTFIGANSTVRNSVSIGDYVLVGAGAYVDRDIESKKVILPARSKILTDRNSDWFIR